MDSSLFFNITTAAYFIAMVVFIIYLTSKSEQVGLVATVISWIGFAANTVAIALRWREASYRSPLAPRHWRRWRWPWRR